MGRLYNFLSPIFHVFLKVRRADWAEPIPEEPVVFLANHLGAVGPMYMSVTFPLKDNVAIWCNEGMMDEKLVVDYVRHDWWWDPHSKLAPFYSATIPHIAKMVVPKVLRSAPTIPVYRDARIMTTMRTSLKALKEGKHIVIFPELPNGHDSHAEHLQMGWLNLVTMYQRSTGKPLKMIPIYIDEEAKLFRVKKAITADADIPLADQQERIERYIAASIRNQL